MNRLFWSALFAFLVLPGTVGFAIPLLWIAPSVSAASFDALGLIPLAPGIVLLALCVREFYVAGRGTLAPWAPPRRLVVTGLYRFSRNPIYVGTTAVAATFAVLMPTRSPLQLPGPSATATAAMSPRARPMCCSSSVSWGSSWAV